MTCSKNCEWHEVYRLMNFVLLDPKEQLKFFYVKNIIPVSVSMHFDYVCLDRDFNPKVVNPIYQLFVSGFLHCYKIMTLLDDLYGDHISWLDMESFVNGLFRCSGLNDKFFEDIEVNTSLSGFLEGEVWKDIRKSSRELLEKFDLIDDINFENPIKFSHFMYPDDFSEYKNIPEWSYRFYSLDEWTEKKNKMMDLYKNIEINK